MTAFLLAVAFVTLETIRLRKLQRAIRGVGKPGSCRARVWESQGETFTRDSAAASATTSCAAENKQPTRTGAREEQGGPRLALLDGTQPECRLTAAHVRDASSVMHELLND